MAKNGRYDPFSGSSSGKNERLRLHNPGAGGGGGGRWALVEIDTKGNLVGQRDRQGDEGGGGLHQTKSLYGRPERRGEGEL